MAMHVLYRSYAKVNLTLEILGRRQDGYHDLASLVHTVSLADDLRLDAADQLLSRVEGLDIEPTANLVAHAATNFARATGISRGAELTLVKRIPAAAGLGGGSSDAATALVGLNSLWQAGVPLVELTRMAGELGSDVPFFVRGGAAVMRGRGDELEPLPALKDQWLVLAVPAHDLLDKTRRLYAALTPEDFSAGEMTSRAAARVRNRESLEDGDLHNGFQRAALQVFDGLGTVWPAAERACGRVFHLSGAGPALFALARDRADARAQQAILAGLGLEAFAVRTVKHARASVKFARDPAIRYP